MLSDRFQGVKRAMRVCPECGEEYLPTVDQCIHCRVALVAAGAAPAPAPRELPPASQLLCIRAASLGFAQRLSQMLSDAGITHRLEALERDAEGPAPSAAARGRFAEMPYGVFVREEDAAAAREVDQAHMRLQIPDLPDETVEAAAGEGCPACGAAVAADAAECPECGLALLEA
jgi:hypothetical protein